LKIFQQHLPELLGQVALFTEQETGSPASLKERNPFGPRPGPR
jgi:hypothetical protein